MMSDTCQIHRKGMRAGSVGLVSPPPAPADS
jgi:hypothetical protein